MRKLLDLLSSYAGAISRKLRDSQELDDACDMKAIALGLARANVLAVGVDIEERMTGDPGAIQREITRRLVNAARIQLSERIFEIGDVHYERIAADGSKAPPEASGGNIAAYQATARFLIVPLPYGE